MQGRGYGFESHTLHFRWILVGSTTHPIEPFWIQLDGEVVPLRLGKHALVFSPPCVWRALGPIEISRVGQGPHLQSFEEVWLDGVALPSTFLGGTWGQHKQHQTPEEKMIQHLLRLQAVNECCLK